MKTIRVYSSTLLPCLAFFVLASGVFSAQGALYSETFDNTTGSNKTAGQVGWSAFVGSTAIDLTNVAGVTNTDYVADASAAGNPNTPNGFIFANNGATLNQKFALVDTLLGSIVNLTNGDSITWTMGNNSTTATAQILIQIGGDGTVGSGTWYVSSTTFRDLTGHDSTAFKNATESSVTSTLTFSSSMTAWKEFTLNSGSSMAVGNTLTADLSSTTITGIGFYLVDGNTGSSMRLDNLQVIPEPGVLALVLSGGLAGVLAVRRRQNLTSQIQLQ